MSRRGGINARVRSDLPVVIRGVNRMDRLVPGVAGYLAQTLKETRGRWRGVEGLLCDDSGTDHDGGRRATMERPRWRVSLQVRLLRGEKADEVAETQRVRLDNDDSRVGERRQGCRGGQNSVRRRRIGLRGHHGRESVAAACRWSFEERSRRSAGISSGRGGLMRREANRPYVTCRPARDRILQGLHRDSSEAGGCRLAAIKRKCTSTAVCLLEVVPPIISKQQLPCGRQRWRAGIRRGTGRPVFCRRGITICCRSRGTREESRDCLTT